MYPPLTRFLQSYGYDMRAPLSPLLLFSILQQYDIASLPKPVLSPNPSSHQQNCIILQQFLNSTSTDLDSLALDSFLYIQNLTVPNSFIVKILTTFHLEVNNYVYYIKTGIFFNLLIATHHNCFKLNFDILTRTFLQPNEQQIRKHFEISLPILSAFDQQFLLRQADLSEELSVDFALYSIFQIEKKLSGFNNFKNTIFRFADQQEQMKIESETLTKKYVISYNLITQFCNIQVEENLKFSSDLDTFSIAKEQISEIQVSNLILILKGEFNEFGVEIRIGFGKLDELQQFSLQVMQMLNSQ